MDEIVKDFLIESAENLDRFDQELVRLEGDPQSDELLASMFRTIHTIKGSAGFLGFARLQKVAHAGENLLSQLRDRELSLTAQVKSGLLAMAGAVRHMLSEIGLTEQDGEDDYLELVETLARLQRAAPISSENPGKSEKSVTFAAGSPPAQTTPTSAKTNARGI
jgi:two-component system, chemotaxis family, sensor kinase CheA